MTRGIGSAWILAGWLALIPLTHASVLPPGTKLEARLCSGTGSRISRPGDSIQALIIAPVYAKNRLAIPQGATLSGVVESVDRVGLGIKHETARINYRFTTLHLPDGSSSTLEARTAEVETARERVAADGEIRGINPNVNLSSGASILISALIADVEFSVPALGVKFLLARSPDPEIYFPAGTELILQLTADAEIPDLNAPPVVNELDLADERTAENILNLMPSQQTSAGQNRPSDLVNVLLLGSHEQMERAFHAAGWYGEQRHSAVALYRMYHCLVQRTGYSMGPMTRLRLNGEYPDAAYQKSLDTFSKRHHVRFWHEQNSGVWVGAATQDISYSFRRMHVTHATEGEIDNERAKVVNDLWLTGCISAASVLHRPGLHIQEPAGIPISTDGDVAVLKLNDCEKPLPSWAVATRPANIRSYPVSHIFVAVLADLAHSNPVTLGAAFTRSVLSGASVEGSNSFSASGAHARAHLGENASRVLWKRPSITDPEMMASPTLTAESLR